MAHLISDVGVHKPVSEEDAEALVAREVVYRCDEPHDYAESGDVVYHMRGPEPLRNVFALSAALQELRHARVA